MFLIHSSDGIANSLKNLSSDEITNSTASKLIPTQEDEIATMCGDVNVVLLSSDESSEMDKKVVAAELMVMVASKDMRNRNIATNAVLAAMKYAHHAMKVERFVVKISNSNTASINLFKNRMKFSLLKEIPAFDETHLYLDYDAIPSIGFETSSSGVANDDDVYYGWKQLEYSPLLD